MRLAEELDYTPAAAARTPGHPALARGRRLPRDRRGPPRPAAPVLPRGARRAQADGGAEGFDLLLFASERPGNGYGAHSYLKRCRHHNVDGVVLMGVDAEDPEVRRLRALDRRRVGVDVELDGPATDTSSVRQRGRRRRWPCATCTSWATAASRTITGLIDTRAGRRAPARLPPRAAGARPRLPRRVRRATATSTSRAAATRRAQLLALHEPPTAVFAASDMMALGAIRAATEAGLGVPRDLSVVGFDDIQLAAHVQPAADHAAPGQGRARRGRRPRAARPASTARPRAAPARSRCPSSSSSAAPPRSAGRS